MKYLSTIVAFFVLLNFCSAQISTNIPAQSVQNETLWESIGDLPMQNLPKFERERILKEDENTINSNRFAAPLLVNFNLNNAGKWLNLANGDRVWVLKVKAKDALSLHILYDNFKLPKGATLHIYNESKTTVLGAFTSINNKKDGKFTTGIIQDDNLILEYYEPIDKKGEGIISIDRIDYGYRSTLEKKSIDKKSNDFGDAGSCNVNINCTAGNNWQDEKKGVVRILVVMNSGSGWCTGSLINNTNNNGTPYVLSAFHCQDGGTPLYSQWTFYFNYEAVGCSNPSSQPTLQSVVGATEKSKYNPSDFLLLELSNSIPSTYNPYYNGWDKSSTTPSNSTSIHHPSGDIKKISVDNQSPVISGYSGNTGTTHWEVVWNTGTTEGGSSGSPLFNASGQIIGQLHGGGASCTSLLSPDYYGRFSRSWTGGGTNSTRLSNWLDPTSSGVASINGYSGSGGGGGTGLVNGCAATSQYPSGTFTPTTSWQTAATNIYAGEYSVYNVTAGSVYEWSICSADGGSATYDTELTLTDASNNELDFNDDFCSTQSKITWTATITGTVRVHVTEYHCLTNSTSTTLVYKKQNSGTPNLDKVTDNLTVSGSSITVSATVENNGTAAAGAFAIRFYASTNTTITTADTEIFTANAANGLAAGASAIASNTVDLCTITGLISGTTYYIGYIIDYANAVAESDETDNTWAWTNTPIALVCQTGCTSTSQYPSTTLTPTTTWQTQTQVYAGEYNKYNVVSGNTYEWSICSADGGSATYDTELTLTNNSNTFIDYNDDFCSTQSKITWTATFTGIVRLHLSEYNCQSNSINTTIAYRQQGVPAQPNLLSPATASLSMTGSIATISVGIQNNGNGAAGAFAVRFYASTNTTISTADQEIAVENITSLAANSTTTKNLTVNLCNVPGFNPSGSYYIGYLIDEPNQVTESDETDNGYYFTNPVTINCVTTSTITLSANPTAGGTVNGGGTFNNGQSATAIAAANPGWTFNGWKENGITVSTNVNYTFTVTANRTLVAEFSQQQYTVSTSANPTSGGSASGNGTFTYGQSATVTASANTGWTFNGWKENGITVSVTASYTFTVTGNRTLVAEFSQQQYTVSTSANPITGGSASGGGNFNFNQSATVTASANTGWNFIGWKENGTTVSTNVNYTFTVTGNRTLVAEFSQQQYTVSTSANPITGGSASGGGNFNFNQSATVTASANTGWIFDGWKENGILVSTNVNYTFNVTANRTLTAEFSQQQFTVAASANPIAGGSATGNGTFTYGQSATLTASANTGWIFDGWKENGTLVSSNVSYTFNVTANRTLTAEFSQQQFTVNLTADSLQGGTVVGGGTYNYGQQVTVTATPTPSSPWIFEGWYEGGAFVSNAASYTFTVVGNRDLMANFDFDVNTKIISKAEANLVLSPNPTSDLLQILIEHPTLNFDKIQIYNMVGQLVQTENLNGQKSKTISVNSLAVGTYIIQIYANDESQVIVEKIIIAK